MLNSFGARGVTSTVAKQTRFSFTASAETFGRPRAERTPTRTRRAERRHGDPPSRFAVGYSAALTGAGFAGAAFHVLRTGSTSLAKSFRPRSATA